MLAGCFRARGPEQLRVARSQPEHEANSQRKQTATCKEQSGPSPSCAWPLPAFFCKGTSLLQDSGTQDIHPLPGLCSL